MNELIVSRESLPAVIHALETVKESIKKLEKERDFISSKMLELMNKENLVKLSIGDRTLNVIQPYKKIFDKQKAIEQATIEGKESHYEQTIMNEDKLRIDYPQFISEVSTTGYLKITENKND